MQSIFWFLFKTILYCYFGYPAALWVLSLILNKKVDKKNYEPHVSLLISVHNEEDVIASKIRNILKLDYPKDKLEVLIASDGSTDRTNEIIRSLATEQVRFFPYTERSGKSALLNHLIKEANGDIIVFADARQHFRSDAVKELTGNFADPRIGSVSGELIFEQQQGEGGTAKGIGLYWHYEKFIRTRESRIHSMIGATGAIYAIRKQLYTPVPENIVLDDVYIPLKIVEKGYRAVFDDKAKALDKAADSPREESRRKVRTLYGNYQIFREFKHLFNPLKSPIAIQFFSHKFLRIIAPFILITLLAVNILLSHILYYKMVLCLQILFYIMAIVGFLTRYQKSGLLKRISNICYAPYVFSLLNFSALIGFIKYAFTKQEVTWEKARKQKNENTSS
jgi:cellulose synthase/poly-beta-1,6-N-acetylglucosamine synthase-like glycosyltransferase